MTSALVNDIREAGAYSASVANSPPLAVLYWLLGVLAAIAYKLGSYFSLRHRPIPQENHDLCTFSKPADNAVMSESLFVVIPAFIRTLDEAYDLQLAIDVLSHLPNERIIVIDDASPIMLSLNGCKLVRHPRNLGPAAARNTGMKLALEYGARSIAFTDADCLPSPKWASKHASLQASSPGIWAGRTIAYDDDVISQFHNDVGTLMPRLAVGGGDEAIYAPTCNLSISASVASKMEFDSGFPTAAFEDCDFCVRARDVGYTVRVSSGPVVKHRFKGGVLGLVRSYFKYGRSFPMMLEKHPTYTSLLGCSHPMSIMTWSKVDVKIE